MAQEVHLMGATYSDVPSISLPDSNGDYHSFVDETDLVTLIEKSITSISNPTVETVGYQVFANCQSLAYASFPNATYVDSYAFRYCYALASVNLPLVERIRNNAFQSDSTLTSINLPSVTRIDSSAFDGCTSLTTVDLASIKQITGTYAFNNCTALTAFVIRNTEDVVALTNVNAFTGADNCIFYVPDDLVDTYKADSKWSTYADRIVALSEYTG